MGRSSTFLVGLSMLVVPGVAAARTVIAGGHIVPHVGVPRVSSGQPRAGNPVTDRYSQEQVTNRYNQEQTTDRYNGLRDGHRRGADLGGFGGGGFGGFGGGDVGLAGAPLEAIPIQAGLPPPSPGPVFVLPPRCPLIIKIGRGLRHPARTQVISGHPFCVDR